MHLNLYVTLSECAPMVPLESLAAGAPCLFGPSCHYFEDDARLHGALVVGQPDSAAAIAAAAERALAERDGIVSAYAAWAPGYNAAAVESMRRFLEGEAAPAA
jgi:hypothetical protein